MKEFKARHSPGGYICRYQGCPRAVQGFNSTVLRESHEESHIPKFRCTELKCSFNGAFKSRAALRSHAKKYHQTDTSPKIPSSLRALTGTEEKDSSISKIGSPKSFEAISVPETETSPVTQTEVLLADLKLEDLPDHYKQEENDWNAIYNPNIKRELKITCVHTVTTNNTAWSISFSADGKFLALNTSAEAEIIDSMSGRRICRLKHTEGWPGSAVLGVCFSPCSNFLATCGNDTIIYVCNTQRL